MSSAASQFPPFDASAPAVGLEGSPAGSDSNLVERARREIQLIAGEIVELARKDVAPADFYHAFLPRVVSALGALGGAVWTLNEEGQLELAYQTNLASARLDDASRRERHARLLHNAVTVGETTCVPPLSGEADSGTAGNPTEFLLLMGPLYAGEQAVGIVEIFQRADTGPVTQRGYVRFLSQMVELASGYLKTRSIQKFSHRQQLWRQLEQYIRRVHASLQPTQVAYTIVNEGRRLIECDRVSLLIRRGKRYQMHAISGVDQFERRALHVRCLETLAKRATATKEPVWFYGSAQELAPQLEEALHALIDETDAHTVAVLPLHREDVSAPSDEHAEQPQTVRTPIGALVLEHFQDRPAQKSFEQRAEAVAVHGAASLANAIDHDSLFLLPLWRWLGQLQVIVAARNLPKTILAAVLVCAAVALLTLAPADFEVQGRGTLEPVIRREVFAGIDGLVTSIEVKHGQSVRKGQLLARLRSMSDLDVAVADLIGKKLAARERITSIERALLGNQQQSAEEQDLLSGELFQLNKTIEAIEAQLELYQHDQQQQVVASPLDGQVVTWQVERILRNRPIRKGQRMMTVVDAAGNWELEIDMPQRRMGHLMRANAASPEALLVRFMLATHPGQEFVGTLSSIGQVADNSNPSEPTVKVCVAVEEAELPELHPGATVSARVQCGQRSLGYVWLHDVFEFVQSQIIFRL